VVQQAAGLTVFQTPLRLAHACDAGDENSVKNCFTADAKLFVFRPGTNVAHVCKEGRSEVVQLLIGHQQSQDASRKHFIADQIFEGQNTRKAHVKSKFLVTECADSRVSIVAGGTYEDQLEKEDGRWLISLRRVILN